MRFSGMLNLVLAAVIVGIIALMAVRQFEKLAEYERLVNCDEIAKAHE